MIDVFTKFLGTLLLLKATWRVAQLLWVHTTRLNERWTQKYKTGSWALVTGCTEGIGKAFAFELAALRFNMVLVSRNRAKLDNVSREITDKFPVDTRIVVADFSIPDVKLYDQIYEQVKDLDISILVNNVGIAVPVQFHETTTQDIQDQLNINVKAITHITHKLLPKLADRPGYRSAMISLSSSFEHIPMEKLAVYNGSKGYDDVFAKSFIEKYRGKIDILSVQPGLVTTALTRQVKNFTTVSAQQCARGSLKALGIMSDTQGHWYHTLQMWVNFLSPDFVSRIFGEIYFNYVHGQMKANEKEQAMKTGQRKPMVEETGQSEKQ